MNDLDSITPFTAAERKEITEWAHRAQHQRGTQGLWARRWLRLEAMLAEAEVDRDTAEGSALAIYERSMERTDPDE